MIDFARARRTMVDCQIRPNDVTDSRIIDAFLAVPRELFVPEGQGDLAYLDRDLPLDAGRMARSLTSPMVLARLINAAAIRNDDAALVVGAATGYAAAVLSGICASVVALEVDNGLAAKATSSLAGNDNVTVVSGPLESGWAAKASYDVIVVDGAVEAVSEPLLAQLAENGRLVAVVGNGRSARATVFVKAGGEIAGRIAFDAAAPALPGFARPPVFAF